MDISKIEKTNKKTRSFFNIRTKLMFFFLVLSLLPFSVIEMISFMNSNRAISSLAFNQLTRIRDTKKVQVENFFTEQKKDLGFLIEAVKSLKQVGVERLNSVHNNKKTALNQYFSNCFSDVRVLSTSTIVRNALADFSSVMDINNNFDKSLYNFFQEVKYRDLLKQFAQTYEYYDLMLVNKNGKIVFTIKKEPDLGQNILKSSELNQSALLNCFKKSINQSIPNSAPAAMNAVIIEDFQPYAPSGGRKIAFIGTPIPEENGATAGVVIFKLTPDAINKIARNPQNIGKSAETYIIGEINGITTYRSDQFFKQGRIGDKVRSTGISQKIFKSFGPVIENFNNSEIEMVKYDPIEIPGLNWVMATSMKLEEVITPALSNKDDYFTRYASLYGFSDIILVSASGDVFYSVAKSVENGTNLVDGPFARFAVGSLFKKISSTGKFGFVGFSSSYKISGNNILYDDPAYGKPFAFIGAPIFENDAIEMVVALKIPLDMINQIMHEQTGMGRSGEIYLVGTDGFSRSFLSNLHEPGVSSPNSTASLYDSPVPSPVVISGQKTSTITPESSELTKQAALSHPLSRPIIRRVQSAAVTSALSGITQEKIIKDYRGIEVLSAYAPIKVFDTTWAIVAEIESSEAFAGLTYLKRNAILITLSSVAMMILISILISRHFAKPIAKLTIGANQLKKHNFNTKVEVRTNDELEVLAQAFNEMAAEIKKYSNELESKVNLLQKTEGELRKSNILLNAIMNGTTETIYVKDLEGRHIVANLATCKALCTTMDNLIGKRSRDFLPPESIKKIEETDNIILKSGQNVIIEIEIPVPGGGSQWWLSNKTPYRDSNGNIIGIIGIGHNITDRKLAEQERKSLESQLRQAQKMDAIGTLAAGVAHDFNNILSAIQGYSEMVMYELPEFSSEKMSMEKVLYACHRAKNLIRQILTFSRRSSEVTRSPLDIHDIVQETMQLIRASTPATIEIVTDINRDCGTILGDPTQIHQVVMNICTNAAHAMDEKGGVMTVTLKANELTRDALNNIGTTSNLLTSKPVKPGRYVTISIQDTGNGITPQNMDRIFDPYFTTKPTGKGAGMGLAVVHGIVQNIGGMITVESIFGEGTIFRVWLPQIENKNNGVSGSKETQINESSDDHIENRGNLEVTTGGNYNGIPGGKEHILVVDDEPDMVEITTHRLEHLGYKITSTTSSQDALIMFEAMPDKFDLIITDQTMPKLTGAELTKKVMKIRQDMPVILCTGYSTKIDPQKAKELGIREFLLKPVDYRKLAFAIRKVIDG